MVEVSEGVFGAALPVVLASTLAVTQEDGAE